MNPSLSTFVVLRRMLAYARPHIARIAGLLAVTVLLIGVNLLQPWPLKVLVDNVVGGRPLPDVFQLIAALPPPDMPSDFARYPNARYDGPQQLAGEINGRRFDRLWFETNDSGSAVIDWFRQHLSGDYQPLATINTGYGERYQLPPTRRVVAVEVFVDPHAPTVFSIDYVPTINSLDTGENRLDRVTLLTLVALATLLLYAASGVLGIWSTALDLQAGQQMIFRLQADLFQHLQSLSLLYHEDRPVGDSMYRVSTDALAVQSLLLGGLLPLASSALTLIAMLAILLSLDVLLALVALLVLPFLYLSARYYAARIAPRAEHVKELESGVASLVGEVLSNVRAVQAFTREPHEQSRFEQHAQASVRARQALTMQETRFHYLVDFATVAGTAAVIWLGGMHILQGQLTLGELLVFLGYLAAVYAPLNAISGTLTVMQEGLASGRRVCEVLDTEPAVAESPSARPLGRVRGDVRFEAVSFAYQPGRHALHEVSFEARAGEAVGIVGASGAGKSTLASLVMRLFDPDSGRVLVDGCDVRQVTLASLRGQVSVVLQEPVLFAASVRDNIAYGRLEASDAEIRAAAVRAGADDFIRQLPDGYQTEIGERGAQLSMGQRQRIAIARAFLKDAPILILDEPTSALDAQNEAWLLDALDVLMRGRTTLIIAHRLSTIRRANQILVIDEGHLVEHGTHDELMACGGAYSRLYQLQMTPPEAAGS
jgi:ATP-binding cassette subfamily B protein